MKKKVGKGKLNHILAFWCLVLLLLHTHLSVGKRVSAMVMDSVKSSELDAMLRREGCAGSGMKCGFPEDAEVQLDTEINRRVLLMQKSYISYETLKRDSTPCERPGASYYNCRSTGVANPYSRGCQMIVGCARDIRDNNY
uniref:Uncharacterized protein n=1 Tax=Kalanchoe fedtschenkoi TaxID=63787 RepID=A0A7N0TSK5_KALFE